MTISEVRFSVEDSEEESKDDFGLWGTQEDHESFMEMILPYIPESGDSSRNPPPINKFTFLNSYVRVLVSFVFGNDGKILIIFLHPVSHTLENVQMSSSYP